MSRTRVKFCGFTQASHIHHACALNVDAVGLVLVPDSARHLSLDQARELIRAVEKPTRSVLLFLNSPAAEVTRAVEALNPDLLQFHGTESQRFCEQFGLPWIKALSDAVAAQPMRVHARACKLRVNRQRPGELGGTGKTIAGVGFPGDSDGSRWVVAGGLSPANVAQRVRAMRPFAVDVSSGIESSPGIKDKDKMTAFMTQVRIADGG